MTLTEQISMPSEVSREDWLEARSALLAKEKQVTRMRDEVNALRRRMPAVRMDKDYLFEGPGGMVRLADLFEGRRQLLVHHFMWFDEPDRFCGGCSLEADTNYGPPLLAELHKRDVTLAAVARAPLASIEREKSKKGWTFPFYSSLDGDFSYDFQATVRPERNSEFNYQNAKSFGWLDGFEGDLPAKSVFLREGDTVYHVYSTYARGTDLLATHYNYLDLTPYGRREEWEDSPEGWPQQATYEQQTRS